MGSLIVFKIAIVPWYPLPLPNHLFLREKKISATNKRLALAV